MTNSTVPPVFSKLDQLALQLLTNDKELRVGQQKHFRTSVPQAFVGQDLLDSFNRRFNFDENSGEAQHLANLLIQHGYVFPVIERAAPVKEDHSLYRLQIPYFWVTHVGIPDNVEYAIYLCKRLHRNEERHGLADYEADAYNKLRELLGHMWDFITTQAEMQLKLFKEKKKSERVVLDSQERAFWAVQRPQGGVASCLEMRYGKAEKRRKKRTARDYEQEIDRLKVAYKTKPWLKSAKSVELLVSWCDQFGDYDPFLAGCQPSNPWISDDPSLWALNADFVEVPTERRVKRWGFSVQELVRDQIGRQVLETFLESEFSSENIRFWMAIQDLKYSPKSEVPEKVNAIYDEYLAAGAPCQVNVDSRTLDAATAAMEDQGIPQRYAFSQAEENIFTLMSRDSYPRFVRSEIYKGVLSAAQQQGSRRMGWRKFLVSLGAGKKLPAISGSKANPNAASSTSLSAKVNNPEASKKPSNTSNPFDPSLSTGHPVFE